MPITTRAGSAALLAGVALAACAEPSREPIHVVRLGPVDTVAIRRDVDYLASDRLGGRALGGSGIDSAAEYVARRFRAMGLAPFPAGYFDPFGVDTVTGTERAPPDGLPARNVVARVAGTDPRVGGEYVVIGAHYDHIPARAQSESDPVAPGEVWNGADDNASGVAAILELGRLLAAAPPRRSVVVVAFSGEEAGTVGSAHFVAHGPLPRERIVAMVNLDMVGRLRNGTLIVNDVGSAEELGEIVDSAAHASGLAVRAAAEATTASDHVSFDARGIPALHLFTGYHADYHRESDDPALVSAAGIARVVVLAGTVVRAIGDREGRLRSLRQIRDCAGAACLRP